MPMPEGWGTLGPFRIPQKLKDAFKEIYKGKVEERVISMIHNDVILVKPDFDKEEKPT